MKKYTEFVVKIYHRKDEFAEDVFLKWLRIQLNDSSNNRKVVVKKLNTK